MTEPTALPEQIQKAVHWFQVAVYDAAKWSGNSEEAEHLADDIARARASLELAIHKALAEARAALAQEGETQEKIGESPEQSRDRLVGEGDERPVQATAAAATVMPKGLSGASTPRQSEAALESRSPTPAPAPLGDRSLRSAAQRALDSWAAWLASPDFEGYSLTVRLPEAMDALRAALSVSSPGE